MTQQALGRDVCGEEWAAAPWPMPYRLHHCTRPLKHGGVHRCDHGFEWPRKTRKKARAK